MNETIGARGGKNDRRRVLRIKKKQQKKLQEMAQEEKLRELEKEVRKQQIYTLVKTLPIIVLGGTIKTITGGNKGSNSEDEKNFIVSDYENGIPPKNDVETKIVTTKEGNRIRVRVPKERNSIFDLISVSHESDGEVVVEEDNKALVKPEASKKKDEKSVDLEIPIDYSFPLQLGTQKKLHDLKSRKLIEEYERELKNIRYDLRQLVFKYNVLVDQENEVIMSDEVQDLIDKLNDIIKKIGDLKNKIKIEDLDKYDANYIYILIEGYLQEFKYGKTVKELKDSPLYILISEKLDELDKEKEKLNKRLEKKKEKFEEREEDFDHLKEKYYDVDRINNTLAKFQEEQEQLLAEIRDKVSKSMSVTERVEVEVEAMSLQSRKLLSLLTLQMFIPGVRSAKAFTMAAASYLYFINNVIKPKTKTRNIKVVTVRDYSSQIEHSIAAIDDATRLLGKTSKQIDKMIYEIKDRFKDYIGVVKECDELIANLQKIKDNLREKEYEMELVKEQQEKELERNNARVLKRGEYPM